MSCLLKAHKNTLQLPENGVIVGRWQDWIWVCAQQCPRCDGSFTGARQESRAHRAKWEVASSHRLKVESDPAWTWLAKGSCGCSLESPHWGWWELGTHSELLLSRWPGTILTSRSIFPWKCFAAAWPVLLPLEKKTLGSFLPTPPWATPACVSWLGVTEVTNCVYGVIWNCESFLYRLNFSEETKCNW